MIRNFRKPLIVAGPKILLRHPECVSTLDDMADGTYFLPVLSDNISKTQLNPEKIKRVLFTSGKHYYTLNDEREKRKRDDVAIIRVEELCPFPVDEIRQEMKKYRNAKEFLWCQEEQRNQGAWTFVKPRFENIVGVQVRSMFAKRNKKKKFSIFYFSLNMQVEMYLAHQLLLLVKFTNRNVLKF